MADDEIVEFEAQQRALVEGQRTAWRGVEYGGLMVCVGLAVIMIGGSVGWTGGVLLVALGARKAKPSLDRWERYRSRRRSLERQRVLPAARVVRGGEE